MNKGKKTIVILSGYFNPVHIGHVDMIRDASKLGSVYVIVNNDEQVKLKGSVPFMHEDERKYILGNIKGVKNVMVSIDKDKTVCESIHKIHNTLNDKSGKNKVKIVFANGGDRKNMKDIPEAKVCKKLGIDMAFNIGSYGKIQSSSALIAKASSHVKKNLKGKNPKK